MNLDERNATQLFVLHRAIGALITTHPYPAQFAQAFGAATALAQVEQLAVPKARAEIRAEAAAFAAELLALAGDEVERRERLQKGGAG